MMVVDKDDLGLSLSLNCSKTTPTNHANSYPCIKPNILSSAQLNLMPSLLSSSSAFPPPNLPFAFSAAPDRNPCTDSFCSPTDRTSEEPCRVVAGVSSPNSTISSISEKRSEREAIGSELDTESRGGSDEEDGDASRKKLRLSKDQSAVLEDSFKENHTLNPKQKPALAKRLGLRPRQVEVWFQNRRARTKLKQTEFDCEFMRKCCEQLTEENRRLQKKVQELRALKLSPQFYMRMTPPTTLTMCNSCEGLKKGVF